MSATESVDAVYKWQPELQPGNITIQLQLPQTLQSYFEAASANVQARYFIFFESFYGSIN